MNRARKLKFILWMITGVAASVGVVRFLFGLGAATNLSDATPWGLWIGFDVMSGVALAAGGFVMTATVYIFRLERFHSVVRPAVLTAFLGYIAVAVGLLFDLGLPWNIWHMVIYWNPHSPLFEVGWCVMLYLTVLTLEFLPVPAEEFSRLARLRRFLIKFRLPLVIAGIGLSSLHQSSLGSLFLIMPEQLDPLWYSPILPVLFFVSAVGLGITMAIFESHSTAYIYHRKPEVGLMASLGGAARWLLLGYLVLRFADLGVRGQLHRVIEPGFRTVWFWMEIAIIGLIPIVLFSIPSVRGSRTGQWVAATIAVSGVVLNRVDVGGLMHQQRGDSLYIPAWTEIAISAGVVSLAVLVFLFFVEHFRVWEDRPVDPQADPNALPELDQISSTWLGIPVVANRTVYSLAFIAAAAAGFALLSPKPASSRGVDPVPVHHARGGDKLWIDGNLDGFGVSFPHQEHRTRKGMVCGRCHHLNLPRDQQSGCYHCHRDMYLVSDAFRHDWHADPRGGNIACVECHPTKQVRQASTAQKCDHCHQNMVAPGSTIKIKQYNAIGYVSAMHQLCIGCHAEEGPKKKKPELARCANCHRDSAEILAGTVLSNRRRLAGKRLILPPY